MRANDLKTGMAIKLDGKLYVLVKYEHTKPGKGPAYLACKLKDIQSGANIDKRFGSTDEVDAVNLDRRTMEFLYADASGFVFMDQEDFDQLTISADFIGDDNVFLAPNMELVVLMYEDKPLSIELPASIEVTVTDTPPGIKGATVTNQLKEATCDTGLKTRVPPFIEPGERIRVSTTDGSYQARA